MQSSLRSATVEDLLLANKLVRIVRDSPEVGLVYRPGFRWTETRGDFPSICVVAVSDSSHGDECEFLDEWEFREPFRSQGGTLIFIVDAVIVAQEQAHMHMVSFGSTVHKMRSELDHQCGYI